jgi:hypothetical protein
MTIDHNLHNLEMQSLEYLLSTHLPLVLARRVLSDGFLRFGFLAVTVYGHTFTAVTRVRIPSGTPTKTECLAKFRPAAVAYIRKFYGNHGAWFSIFGPTTSAVQLQSSTRICARNGSDRPDLERKLRPTGQQIPFWRFSRESGKSAFEATRSQIATALGPGSGCPSTLVSPNT